MSLSTLHRLRESARAVRALVAVGALVAAVALIGVAAVIWNVWGIGATLFWIVTAGCLVWRSVIIARDKLRRLDHRDRQPGGPKTVDEIRN